MKITFDIETDGDGDFSNLAGFHTVHCLSYQTHGNPHVGRKVGKEEVVAFFRSLETQALTSNITLIGHNIISFDLPVLAQILADTEVGPFLRRLCLPDSPVTIHDTTLIAKLGYPDIYDATQKTKAFMRIPKQLHSSHSLKAWGYRVGSYKGSIGDAQESQTWESYSEDMGNYCDQDVRVTAAIYDFLMRTPKTSWLSSQDGLRVIRREAQFAQLIRQQEIRGVSFDVNKAHEIASKIEARLNELTAELSRVFPPETEEMKTPQYYAYRTACGTVFRGETKASLEAQRKKRKLGPKEVELVVGPMKVREIPFNPGSRQQIVQRLQELYGWVPEDYTEPSDLYPEGQPKVDEDILSQLEYPEAKLLSEYLGLSKVRSYITGSKSSWVDNYNPDTGALHGRVNTLGANTSRCTHSSPNLAQVPSARKPFGQECREMFRARPGYAFVGCDASGLELRVFAGYLAHFDQGAYADTVTQGDVHTANQEAAGLSTRDKAKTFIYAFLYGAGDAKIGSIASGGAEKGAELRQAFLDKTPGLDRLVELVKRKAKTHGFILGLDRRHLYPRSAHSALNLLIQGAGAIIMKEALIQLYFLGIDQGILLGRDYHLVLNVHDEFQAEVSPEVLDTFLSLAPRAITKAGEVLGFKCPLDGEARSGETWADTH